VVEHGTNAEHQLALVEAVEGQPGGRALIHLASKTRPLAAKMLKDTAPAAAEQLQPSVHEDVRVLPVKKRQLVGTPPLKFSVQSSSVSL